MEKLMTFDTIRNFAYVNTKVCKKPIRGIVLNFMGLGGMNIFDEDIEEGYYFGERGLLYVMPYNNPWGWMNAQAVAFTDELVDVLAKQFDLPDGFPLISTGGSMGGLSALTYCVYAKRTPTGCVAICPVCDLPYHFTERPDLPRTLYSAYWHETSSLADAMKARSPLHLVDKLPDIPYLLYHTGADLAVNIDKHTIRLCNEMQKAGKSFEYRFVPDRGHCDLTPEEWKYYRKTILRFAHAD